MLLFKKSIAHEVVISGAVARVVSGSEIRMDAESGSTCQQLMRRVLQVRKLVATTRGCCACVVQLTLFLQVGATYAPNTSIRPYDPYEPAERPARQK